MNYQNWEKINIFKSLFHGMTNVYGSYDIQTGRSYQVKKPVTDRVILNHLQGKRPYGVYLLMKDKIRAITSDFDIENPLIPMEFFSAAKHYRLDAYIERSKSKGYHVWIFFEKGGVLAQKARSVVQHILEEIEHPETEVFPKQNRLDGNNRFGNFINTPLFGGLVPQGKTVFIDPYTFNPYKNQWEFLTSINRHSETLLDNIIEINNIQTKPNILRKNHNRKHRFFSLPPCIQIILQDGVTEYQRNTCFRLAAHFKRIGIPFDGALAIIGNWSNKNKPKDNKLIITEKEIVAQTSYAYKRNYNSFGCSSKEINPFCQPECPLAGKIEKALDTFQFNYQRGE